MRTFRASTHPSRIQRPSIDRLPAWKRGIDLTFCCAALPFFAAGTFFVAVLMSVTSPGPIFFKQERVGYRGRRFRLYKFRTMHVGADTANHQAYFTNLMASNLPMQKLDAKGDARLIPLGWLIRALGLDELPQIINVFRGDMSVVGPRPCIPYEYENYSVSQRARFTATPGLTGLWQVSGKNRTTFERMIELDIEYAARRSFLVDLRILLLTLPAVILQLADQYKARQQRSNPLPTSQQSSEPAKALEIANGTPSIRAS